MSYQALDHTGDLGFEIDAPTAPELFVVAADTLFEIMVDVEAVEERESRTVAAEGADLEELLVAFLGELLFLHDADDFLVRRTEIRSGPDVRVEAEVFGEPFDGERHRIERQIKAVTYHALFVREEGDAWRARVILDI